MPVNSERKQKTKVTIIVQKGINWVTSYGVTARPRRLPDKVASKLCKDWRGWGWQRITCSKEQLAETKVLKNFSVCQRSLSKAFVIKCTIWEEEQPKMWVERKGKQGQITGAFELGKKLVFILIVIKKSLGVLNKRKGLLLCK